MEMVGIKSSEIKLVAMDLDGTLTQHKSNLDENCRRALENLALRYKLLIIGAGGCERIYRQINSFPIDIIGHYGMQLSTVTDRKLVLLKNNIERVDKHNITRRVDMLRTELGFTGYAGQTVEFHDSGMITFPILGTTASIEQKLNYDPDRKKRRACYAKVRDAFYDYTVFIGGSSSFDIVPLPYNKLYALNAYMETNGLTKEHVIYFGDDYGDGGNDEQIYLSDISFVCVDDYRKFPKAAETLL